MKNPYKFPLNPVEDWIVIERIDIKSKDETKILKLGLVKGASSEPKNIMEIEQQRRDEYTAYADASTKFLSKWDKHPNQAVIMAVGPGRHVMDGKIVPLPVKAGQKIYYRGSTGEPVVVNKKLYFMIKAHEVFGIVY